MTTDKFGNWEKCPTCKDYDFSKTHQCHPRWECSYDQPNDWFPVYAPGELTAVERAARHVHDAQEELIIYVRKPGEQKAKKHTVECRLVVEFISTEEEEVLLDEVGEE